MVEKLVVVIMGQNCEKFLPMCLESVRSADEIIYCDGGSEDSLFDMINQDKVIVIRNNYSQSDPAMNGKQRNFYLNDVRRRFPDYWCLALDADEVVEDLGKIKQFIQTALPGVYSVKMRHFHENLGHEDATVPKHMVINRLFKISSAEAYTEVEHSLLQPRFFPIRPPVTADTQILWNEKENTFAVVGQTEATTIWHLAHLEHCFSIKKRYEKNLKHSNIHDKAFLDGWNKSHLLGVYPKKQVDPIEIPEVILKHFNIDKDEFYFKNRGLEMKHFIMAKQWLDYFREKYNADGYNPKIIDYGCGFGPYGFVFNYLGCKGWKGVELSHYVVKKNQYNLNIVQGDITTYNDDLNYDITLAIDVLEHLDDKQLIDALKNIAQTGCLYVFSIPFIGDPNLENDKTHKQFRTKQAWKDLLTAEGYTVEDAPTSFAFHPQLLIGNYVGKKGEDNVIHT